MRESVFLVLVSCVFYCCTPKTGEIARTQTPVPVAGDVVQDTLPFPVSWVGDWVGELDIWRGSGKAQTVPMTMSISPADQPGTYYWKTVFGEDEATTKPYLLKTTDAANGLYVIDEQNSIVIESYLFDNKLVSWYIVMENLILASFEKRDDHIVFEILAGSEKPVSISGGQRVDEEDIPSVKTLPFTVMQRAILRKKS